MTKAAYQAAEVSEKDDSLNRKISPELIITGIKC